jgi:N-acetylglutamate synthase-like GNAT family acetyltransferase
MSIRRARVADAADITRLLDQLGYPDTEAFVAGKIERILADPNADLVVYEAGGDVVGVLALSFICQLAMAGDFARIAYFAVDERARSQGVGDALEQYCVRQAEARNCSLIEVHCHERRIGAHRFYHRQGYAESPKYLLKRLGNTLF